MTKNYFNKNNIIFKEIDVSSNQDSVKEMMEKSGQMGVPVVEIDGKIIVGFQPALLNSLLGIGSKTDLVTLIAGGAVIIDVRTSEEYADGHIKDSLNIPLDVLEDNMESISKDKPVITCCASGSRSGVAKTILEANGFKDVYNGGAWNDLKESKGGGICIPK
jgi:rhodanese-related sulfurtransferase/glutaredoxin